MDEKYNAISNELYGMDYHSIHLTKLQALRVRTIYDERAGHIDVSARRRMNRSLNKRLSK